MRFGVKPAAAITAWAAAALIACAVPSPPAWGQPSNTPPKEEGKPASDDFIAGYATAVLEREFGVKATRLSVRDGDVRVWVEGLSEERRRRLGEALRALRGVRRVEVRAPEGERPPAAKPPVAAEAAEGKGAAPAAREFLPEGDLFAPLIADPRWPHFSLVYQNLFEDKNFRNVFAPSFGESLPLVRFPALGGKLQFGIQAAVFPFFDLDADSFDLINADYWIAGTAEFRKGEAALLLRLFHQSSHLGDEFLLRNPTNRDNRVNLSYEAVNLLLSREFLKGAVRLYGGAEYILHKEPSDLKPWTIQYGIELRSPVAFFGNWLRPVGGVDVKNSEEADWELNLSARVGVQFDSSGLRAQERQIQLMLEYFTGRSPNGQFYDQTIKYYGLGLHFYF